MDLAVFIVLLVIVIVVLKDIKWVTYLIGILEIFLRLIHYIGDNLGIVELDNFVDKFFPDSLFTVIGNYSSGIVYDILAWVLVIFFVWFFIYLVNSLFRGR